MGDGGGGSFCLMIGQTLYRSLHLYQDCEVRRDFRDLEHRFAILTSSAELRRLDRQEMERPSERLANRQAEKSSTVTTAATPSGGCNESLSLCWCLCYPGGSVTCCDSAPDAPCSRHAPGTREVTLKVGTLHRSAKWQRTVEATGLAVSSKRGRGRAGGREQVGGKGTGWRD